VCDNGTPASCQSATVYFTVTEASAAPSVTVVDDYSKTPAGVILTGNVLTNDTHSTNAPLTVTPVTLPTVDQGVLTLNSDGSYKFVPAPGFSGTVEVVYTACGGTPSVCAKGTLHILVAAPLNDELTIFNGISVNGDGKNDFFEIQNIQNYPDNTVEIYNRWGVKVFEVNGYGINGNVFRGLSDGRATMSRGVELPEGTYFYIIRYANSQGVDKQRSGYLYIKQ
jgi:gliding motility-associated-like protein